MHESQKRCLLSGRDNLAKKYGIHNASMAESRTCRMISMISPTRMGGAFAGAFLKVDVFSWFISAASDRMLLAHLFV